MNRSGLLLAACLLALLVPSPACTAQESEAMATTEYPRATLSKPYAATLGDLIALNTSELITSFKSMSDAPTIAIYDRDAKKIVIIQYGSRSSLDGAKKGIDDMRKSMGSIMQIVGGVYKVAVAEADFGYIYSHDGKELVRWEDGKYTVAGE